MSIRYDPLPSTEKERLKKEHARGVDLVASFERDLASGKLDNWFTLVRNPNRYAIVYTP